MKINSADFKYSVNNPLSMPRPTLPEISFMGRSNVGKSSLLNSLLDVRGLARTSSTPGRTKSLNFFLINEAFYFVDLPGYGYAKVSKAERAAWGQLMENYLAQRECLVLSILIVDARHEPSPLDLQMKSWLQHFGLDYLVVSTKIDKLSPNERSKSLQRTQKTLGSELVIPYSSLTREGTGQVWEAIRAGITAKQ